MIYWVLVGIALAVTFVIALVWRVIRQRHIASPGAYWRKVLVVHLVLLVVHSALTVPAFVGYVGSRMVGTRGDERAYAGPRLDGDLWLIQNSDTLRDDREAGRVAEANPFAVELVSGDGLELRGFYVTPTEDARLAVVMVHGLFRGAMELESPARMFRRAGAAVLMIELRNHGGSQRAPFTGGRDESLDVIAAAEWLGAKHPDLPLAVFGASLGTAAAALAAPRIAGLDGVWLDAPMDDLDLTARRFLGGGGRIALFEPFRSLVLRSLELWSGFKLSEVRPAAALASLSVEVRVQLVAAGRDNRMPIEAVRRVYEGLPQPEGRRDLWFSPDATHAKVWLRDPAGYAERVAAFVDALAAGI